MTKPAHREYTIESGGRELWCCEITPQPKTRAAMAILSHGLTNDHSDAPLFAQMQRGLLEAGFGVVVFDYFGSGRSDGMFRDKTLSVLRGNLGDVLGHVARERAGEELLLFGRSVGGALCAFYAKHPAVHATVVASAPFDFVAAFDPLRGGRAEGSIPLPSDTHPPSGQLKGPYELSMAFFDELASMTDGIREAISGAERVLVLQGTADTKVGVEHAQGILARLGSDSEHRLLADAGHNYEGFEDAVVGPALAWFERWARPTERYESGSVD